jgi:hypothetical protein
MCHTYQYHFYQSISNRSTRHDKSTGLS